tara:strand:+ start:3581 stop:4408 length:828 start_codon:yes stop_codon:yes gene_type:complete
MAVEAVITDIGGVVHLTLNGTVKRGESLAHNGTNWVKADATDAATNLYAQYIALESGVSGDLITACKQCTLSDADAPWTANGTLYVSATAGALTQTRPATNGDVIQVVGRALDTNTIRVEIQAPREIEVFIPCPPYNALSGVEAHTADGTTNEWAGADVDTDAVGGVFVSRMPSGMVGAPLAADLIVDTQASTALDIDVTFVAAYDGAANTGDAGTTQTGLTSATTTADNKIHKVSILSGMDADFAKAGINFGVAVDADAGDFLLLQLYMRYLVV